MSRVGLKPIMLPDGVTLTQTGQRLSLQGPKGTLELTLPKGIKLEQKGQILSMSRSGDHKRAVHGLSRALLASAIVGVSQGYELKLEIHGVGYKANVAGTQLKFSLGRSHEQTYDLPEGISAALDQNVLTISGIDKAKVGQVASAIRALKKPEPYKGKGIRFVDEYVIRKSGKTAVAGKE